MVAISFHSISTFINPDQRSVTLAEVCDGMREDLKAYPELDKAQVILGVVVEHGWTGHCRF
ncbi:hypothetical protein [Phocaeicola dorei]|uniref:hypothetical protein n=1 Tax=Phocaeicola dorei TaxID=357276 RepID=UPI00211E68BF|nr:hypothetical protein [Phocaeicola dorei]